MDEPLRNTAPVGATHGWPERQPQPRHREGRPAPDQQPAAHDLVQVAARVPLARRLLRERVLAHTRRALDLPDGIALPEFAEAIDDTPAVFVGRLLGAQNLLVGRAAAGLTSDALRRRLDRAFRDGVEETLELVTHDPRDDAALQAVTEVLMEYARRIAVLADDTTAAG